MTATKIVAVSEEQKNMAGAIVYWTLSGGTDAARLTANWCAARFPEEMLPALPTPTVALHRALNEQRAARRLARPLEGKKGRALVDEDARNDDLDYDVLVKVSVNVAGRLEFTGGSDELREEITSAYRRHLDMLSHTDISAWVIDLVRSCDAVPLRGTGGVYFVPRHSMPRWEKMVSVIRASSSHYLYSIPALPGSEAAEAFLDAVSKEAQAEADAMETDLNNAADFGERALRTRVARVEEMKAKVERYENLLGSKLDTLRERLDSLKAGLAAAALATME